MKKFYISGIVIAGVAGVLSLLNQNNQQILPNPSLTPGSLNPDITQSNISENICNKNWSTKSIRPPSSYTTALKIKQINQYGYKDTATKDYEEDHLISLELGGNPTDPANLWPQSYLNALGARQKDLVENYLHSEVCSGSVTLLEAQNAIKTDWTAVWNQMKGKVGNITPDQDDE